MPTIEPVKGDAFGNGPFSATGHRPTLLSGRLTHGDDCHFGENVVIDVAEECVFGDRCVVPDNARFEGRRIEFGDDFFGYSWDWRRLDVGRGRRDDEDAVLKVGSRCTFHDNRIDLSRAVTVGDDVGLSPEVVVYTHGYWMSCLEGFPCRFAPVEIGSGTIVGFRSTVLAGASLRDRCVVGAGSVVPSGLYMSDTVYAGNPAKCVRNVVPPEPARVRKLAHDLVEEYRRTARWRGIDVEGLMLKAVGEEVSIRWRGFEAFLHPVPRLVGEEDEFGDDLRWFLFSRGVRIYTKRRFRKMRKR